MKIDANTKVIGRFHKEPSPRGLNIYNPYFQETGTNAVYLLFYNQDPQILIDGMRNLKLSGAITAGFESDEVLPTIIDELDEASKFINRIGYITQHDGKIVGHAQGGVGMFKTVSSIAPIKDQKLVIVGAGNIAKGFLLELEKSGLNCQVVIYNRDLSKGELLKKRFGFIKSIGDFSNVSKSEGDIFINLTDIGGAVTDYSYDLNMIKRFNGIVDVTFQVENTDLVTKAKELGIKVATGWDMFTYQGQVCLEGILGERVDFEILKKHVAAGLSETVK